MNELLTKSLRTQGTLKLKVLSCVLDIAFLVYAKENASLCSLASEMDETGL